ncbi:MAG: hypothetical protein M1837_005277 [Sclerophora amabilis]|nr:MAG: hypothetical protein M1837_005277 [Sclerophora amabilis]
MASLPPRSSGSQRRRSSPRSQARAPSSAPDGLDHGHAQTESRSRPADPEESQTVLLNNLRDLASTATTLEDEQQRPQQQQSPEQRGKNQLDTDLSEPRKCWICLTNETEDTPLSSEWRSPCPCALTAHEACLLDWIADLQSPNKRKRQGRHPEILCPQCKSKIVVVRPRSLVVDGVNSLERLAGWLIIPGVIGVLGGCVVTGCFIYGVNTIYIIFGEEEASRILGHGAQQPIQDSAGGAPSPTSNFWILFRNLTPFAAYHGWSWRLGIGLPVIPAALVLSRTTLADYMLPVLPIIFFATQSPEWENLDLVEWQPSPAMSLAVLPYLRGAYNELYERCFGERERRWIKEVQPHHDGAQDDDGAHGDAGQVGGAGEAQDVNEDDIVMELNLEVDVIEEEVGGGAGNENANPERQPQQHEGNGHVDENAQAVPVDPVAAQQNPGQRANNIMISTSHLADTVLGALLFPAISAAMGGLLKLSLPRSWTTPPPSVLEKGRRVSSAVSGGGLTSILQARWGRSIVGGCLFVVLKDALVLYYRWKMAQSHRNRRVLDYDRTKAKKKSGKGVEVGGGDVEGGNR